MFKKKGPIDKDVEHAHDFSLLARARIGPSASPTNRADLFEDGLVARGATGQLQRPQDGRALLLRQLALKHVPDYRLVRRSWFMAAPSSAPKNTHKKSETCGNGKKDIRHCAQGISPYPKAP